MGNYYQALTEEQKAIYQSICDEYYDRFVEIVAQSRGMDQEKVYQLADRTGVQCRAGVGAWLD